MENVPCAVCKTPYSPKVCWQKYCSKSCRFQAFAERIKTGKTVSKKRKGEK